MTIPFESALDARLAQVLHQELHDVLHWAVMPPGKLFRPRLVEALGKDLQINGANLLHLGVALELHHAYSLVHDDMPCMDDDDIRRGKPTTHKQFGEWRALLAGDSLLALSYAELERIQHLHAGHIRRMFHWATGPKGLILGQWIDLGLEGVNAPATLLRMHELKTARLMQVATLGVTALSGKIDLTSTKQSMRLGSHIGLAFQLLDDLDDLTTTELSAHEKEVNPFLLSPGAMSRKLAHILATLDESLVKLPHTRSFLQAFLRQSAQNLLNHKVSLRERLPSITAELEVLLTSGVFA